MAGNWIPRNQWVAQQKLEGAKKRLLKIYPNIPEKTGIYVLKRIDENGFKYAYVGQTRASGGILERLAQHLLGYQHIDLSIKKHKLAGEHNVEYGWQIEWFICESEDLNDLEQKYIFYFASKGYQMRNKTIGSQGKGKDGLGGQKASKGYYDGVKQGYANCLKDIREYFEKYLDYHNKTSPECFKKPKRKGDLPMLKEIYEKKFKEFKDLMEGKENELQKVPEDCE